MTSAPKEGRRLRVDPYKNPAQPNRTSANPGICVLFRESMFHLILIIASNQIIGLRALGLESVWLPVPAPAQRAPVPRLPLRAATQSSRHELWICRLKRLGVPITDERINPEFPLSVPEHLLVEEVHLAFR